MPRSLSRLSSLALVLSAAIQVVADEPPELIRRGEEIYRTSCTACHGAAGQGVAEEYDQPLAGELSVEQLARLITETMPEEDPDACVGSEAAAVAAYIHGAFYGEAARIRQRPPRAALSRLTGDQLRQSLADLFGHFHDPPQRLDPGGLRGIYFDGAKWQNDKKKIERVDRAIAFDFADRGPGEGINAKDYYIHWSGSLKVNQTGRYEIVLRSSCSCMMYLGAEDRELVNNHVQSQGREEFRRTMQLTAGRAYPIKLEFFQRKRKTKQPAATISLSWVPPGGVEEIIPARHLIPETLPAAFPLQAKLPADDRSYGYERGTSIDRPWDDSTTAAAIEFAEIAVDELYPRYRQSRSGQPNPNRATLRRFLAELVAVAFRGPLDEATKAAYIDRQVDAAEDDAEAIKRTVLATLKSPRFLYPTLDANRTTSQRAANRLALVLFDSLPSDKWLIRAARGDELEDTEQVRQAAERMIGDYRAEAKLRSFLYEWFDLADLDEIAKDGDMFAGFDAALVQDLKQSFDAFLDQVVWSEASDFRQLVQADWAMTNQRLESFYAAPWQAVNDEDDANTPTTMRRSVSDPTIHVGAITHPLLLSKLAYHRTSSPIHRGVFLNRRILGRVIRPPRDAFTPLPADLHPELTTRQRVELQTGDTNCQVCHKSINSLGFPLENFDAVGRWRETEKDKPIDSSGGYTSRNATDVSFAGARQLGDFLAESEDCHRAFVEAAFEHFVKQPIAAYGPDLAERLTESFQQSGFDIRQLIVSIALVAAEMPADTGPET